MPPLHSHNYAGQLLNYVDEHLDQTIRLADLASRLHMSPSHYHHAFTRATGTPPMQMVREARLQRAQELLRTTDWSIKRIALEVGYRWETHFCKRFRQHAGLSPEVYRRQHQTQQSLDTLPVLCALWPKVGPETQAAVLALLEGAVKGGRDA